MPCGIFLLNFHGILAGEFARELHDTGRIYMYRFRPDYEIKARHIDDFPILRGMLLQ